jgi:glycosyltransferase involved in cell wall biosynthesis
LLILTPTLECGGAERYVKIICENLDASKFDITLGIVDNSKPFYQIDNPLVTVKDLACTAVRKSLPGILSLVEAYRPDIIYSTANHLNLFLAIHRSRFKGIPVVFRESSIISVNSSHAKSPFLYKMLLRLFYRRADMIICQSVAMQEDLIRSTGTRRGKTCVIHNPVYTPAGTNHVNATGIPAFISVGRLSPEKGYERLLDIMSTLSFPFTYKIYGEGPMRVVLQEKIATLHLEDKVFLKGMKEDPYSDAGDIDIMLMGSLYEGFPNVLLEAGTRGIPSIAFDVPGGIAEIIRDGQNGYLVKDGDKAGFRTGINELLRTGWDRNRIIEMTRNRFSADAHMSQLEPLLQGFAATTAL